MKNTELNENKDALLFLEYIINNGFNPNNYENILELIQSVPNSMSKYLKSYRQFLLSKKVNYSDLEKYRIKGANGYLNGENGIFIPKNPEADEYFSYKFHHKKYKANRYRYPNILNFNSVITYHDWSIEDISQIKSTLYYLIKDYYIGFITNKSDKNLGQKLKFYQDLLEEINMTTPSRHTIVHDTINNKELYLIKKK